ncbi:MAG: NRAMP family divalent metal transporter [Solirubrobacteraceae bacterium]
METTTIDAAPSLGRRARLARALVVFGPGLMVMLADTDAGSIVTAAKSGADWGYRLLPLEVLLIPVLYVVMEITVRLAATTGKGHAEAIRDTFGARWAAVSVGGLVISVTGALITEFAGLAAVGGFVGIPPAVTVSLASAFLIGVVVTGGYRRVELIGLALGTFEMAFLVAAVLAQPRLGAITSSFWSHQPLGNRSYLMLVAANVGAVVMPWMIFYQQGAVINKGLREHQLNLERIDTGLGAVVTQLIMIAVLVVTAGTLNGHHSSSLGSIGQIASALTPYLGEFASHLTFAMGVTGAALLAALVVSLAASWAVAEALGSRHSLDDRVRRAPLFYGIYTASVATGAAVVLLAQRSLVTLSIDVEVLNALLLPMVIGFLAALAWKALPTAHRLHRRERFVLTVVLVLVSFVGVSWIALALFPA